MFLSREDEQSPPAMVSKYTFDRQECLLAFLKSKSASAAVGHWLSLLLKVISELSCGYKLVGVWNPA